jgi:quinate dehydrogenase
MTTPAQTQTKNQLPSASKKGEEKEEVEDILQTSYTYGTSPFSPTTLHTPHRTFLIGNPISHSLAPLLHNTLFRNLSIPWTYSLHEVPNPTSFNPKLREPDVIGCAVTMPYKITLAKEVDALTEEARVVGAINTVFLRKEAKSGTGEVRYIGTNTDTIGIREAFLQNFPGIRDVSRGQTGLVIGGGGAARSAVYALWKWMGMRRIYLVNRLRSEVEDIIASFGDAEGFDGELVHVGTEGEARVKEMPVLVVGTVPDLEPSEEGERRARRVVEVFLEMGKGGEKGFVLEMCYHPRIRTGFYEMAEREGWRVLPGTEAMIYQGIAQQVLWTEMPLERFPVAEAKRVIDEALVKKH